MKTGDRVKLISMKEIEEAAKDKFPGMMVDSSGNCWLDVPDVKLGDVGVLGGCDAKGLFNCRFDTCTVIVNEAMVEPLPCWTGEAPTKPGWYWHRWRRDGGAWHVQMTEAWQEEDGTWKFGLTNAYAVLTVAQVLCLGAEFWSEPLTPPKDEDSE